MNLEEKYLMKESLNRKRGYMGLETCFENILEEIGYLKGYVKGGLTDYDSNQERKLNDNLKKFEKAFDDLSTSFGSELSNV